MIYGIAGYRARARSSFEAFLAEASPDTIRAHFSARSAKTRDVAVDDTGFRDSYGFVVRSGLTATCRERSGAEHGIRGRGAPGRVGAAVRKCCGQVPGSMGGASSKPRSNSRECKRLIHGSLVRGCARGFRYCCGAQTRGKRPVRLSSTHKLQRQEEPEFDIREPRPSTPHDYIARWRVLRPVEIAA